MAVIGKFPIDNNPSLVEMDMWRNAAQPMAGALFTTSQLHNGAIYVYAQQTYTGGGGMFAYLIEYKIWHQLSPTYEDEDARYHSHIYDEKMYVVPLTGGVMRIYDIAEDEWLEGAASPTDVAYGSTQLYNKKIYCVGLLGEADVVMHVYDIEEDSWESYVESEEIVYFSASQQFGGKMYCIGSNAEGYARLAVFNLELEEWEDAITSPFQLYCFTSQLYNEKIYCVGDPMQGETLEVPLHVFDIRTQTWQHLSSGYAPGKAGGWIYYANSHIHNDKLYLIPQQRGYTLIYDFLLGTWTVGAHNIGRAEDVEVTTTTQLYKGRIYCPTGYSSEQPGEMLVYSALAFK